ncbi:F-box/FBD/LRR-repeat protein At1g13570-like [Silene latifolia]|uniref:F-box/FBD/LRR-repeat protein At1g13570-like n=1 Tax=Silene latifolia TaxID=37657 RepID=UPI003D77ADB1
MACSKSAKNTVDFFSNAPDIVIDKILESLPIRMAARTSVLSKQWSHAWLSLKKLNFDADFWEELADRDDNVDWRKGCQIICDILLCHNGPVHDLDLNIPYEAYRDRRGHRQWISFLSKNGVRKIVIKSCSYGMDISPHIFRCNELVHLEISAFYLNPPPTDFIGFPYLKHLVLEEVKFIKQSIFCSLIENCRMLETLKLVKWSGMDYIVIDVPSLQTLVLSGDFESLAFRNVRSLKSISLCLKTLPKNLRVEQVDAVNLPASSCQLQSIEFDGHLFLAAGGIIRPPPVTFIHLHELCLSNLNLSDFGVSRYLLHMIECCPYIKKLDIAVLPGENVGQDMHDYNYSNKLDHLLEVNITGITGTSAELKLVEYLFAVSPVLKNLFFKSGYIGIESQLNMSQSLMRFPRASAKASLVCLKI